MKSHLPRPLVAIALVVAALLVPSACTNKAAIVPLITEDVKEGSTDLVFQMRDHRVSADGSQRFSAVALLDGREVGFDVELGRWNENPPGYVNMTTWDCKARLVSRGEASDAFLRHLDVRYGTTRGPKEMVDALDAQAISPWKNPGAFEDGETMFMLSIQPGIDERAYAEFKLIVDRDDGRVRWKEKDAPQYRASLIAALTAPDRSAPR